MLLYKSEDTGVWFAWYPVETIDKEWVWFEKVERIWNPALFSWMHLDPTPGFEGGWEYRRVK